MPTFAEVRAALFSHRPGGWTIWWGDAAYFVAFFSAISVVLPLYESSSAWLTAVLTIAAVTPIALIHSVARARRLKRTEVLDPRMPKAAWAFLGMGFLALVVALFATEMGAWTVRVAFAAVIVLTWLIARPLARRAYVRELARTP